MTGQLFVIVGPSGAGKDTLLQLAVAADPGLHWARRVITRPETGRAETGGAETGGAETGGAGTGEAEPFQGVTTAAFQARLAAGDFALDWQAHGLSYAVPKSEFAPLDAGRDVLLNGSRGALLQVQARFPALHVIRITAPAAVLAGRLALRGRESRAEIELRLLRAEFALPDGISDREVVNDATPEIGLARLFQALRG